MAHEMFLKGTLVVQKKPLKGKHFGWFAGRRSFGCSGGWRRAVMLGTQAALLDKQLTYSKSVKPIASECNTCMPRVTKYGGLFWNNA